MKDSQLERNRSEMVPDEGLAGTEAMIATTKQESDSLCVLEPLRRIWVRGGLLA